MEANSRTPLVSNVSAEAHRARRRIMGAAGGLYPPRSSFPALEASSNAASNSSNTNAAGGRLKATILSAYDLNLREPPAAVTVTVGNQTVSTGPPVQRHKDRNSFKFRSNNNSNNNAHCVSIQAPLPDLYRSTAVIRLVYENQPTQTLQANYKLHQLKVHETAWLVLHLDPASSMPPPEDTSSSDNQSLPDNSATDLDEDGEVPPPTLRLQLELQGPYRTEIAAAMQLGNTWFALMDAIDDQFQVLWSHVPKVSIQVDPKYILIPAAPILAIAAVSLPAVLGAALLVLPALLPLLVAAGTVLTAVAAASLLIYSSTRTGRMQLQHALVQPAAHTLLSTRSGQRLVYQTGPRPTPVKVAAAILPTSMWGKLVVSLAIDAAGSASYLVPVVGEVADLGWAPLQTCLLMAMYDKSSPNLKYISFLEEILPFTDVIPSAVAGWLWEFALPASLAQLGVGGSSPSTMPSSGTSGRLSPERTE